MKMLIIIMALLTPQMASARIGETLEECDTRYGKPTIHDEEMISYAMNGYDIYVFHDGSICNGISYRKKDESGMSDAVIESLMSKMGDGWSVVRTGEYKIWTTKSLRALYNRDEGVLMISLIAAVERGSAEMERKELEALEGL